MNIRSTLCMCLLFTLGAAAERNADKESRVGDISVKVLGKSGKISMRRHMTSENGTERMKQVHFSLSDLDEIDGATGEAIGTKGLSSKHSVNGFSGQSFNISEPEDGTIPDSDIQAKFVNLYAQLTGLTSTISAAIYIAKESGSITIANETTDITVGTVKFSLELSNWQWCGDQVTCQKGNKEYTGAYVDVAMELKTPFGRKPRKKDADRDALITDAGGDDNKGKKGGDGRPPKKGGGDGDRPPKDGDGGGDGDRPPKEGGGDESMAGEGDGDRRSGKNGKRRPAKYDLGGAAMQLSNEVRVDDEWTEMPEGYPKVIERGSKQIMVFRFPKFDSTAFYDPSVEIDTTTAEDHEDDETSSATIAPLGTTALSLVLSAWLVLAAL